MFELIALTVGAMLGVALHRLGPRIGIPLVAGGALATGFFVSSLSGELEVSWGFLLFDIGQVVAAAAGAAVLLRALERRRATQ
jgi:hypothetical protein